MREGESYSPLKKDGVGRSDRNSHSVTDHPHAGGENDYLESILSEVRGPSPRGWGKLGEGDAAELVRRTIPTRVGKTICVLRDGGGKADHPHAGGENRPGIGRSMPRGGPSPRGWGKQRYPLPLSSLMRTIPTRVGKTPACSPVGSSSPDHPHAGGENCMASPMSTYMPGPSPRGWGKLSGMTEMSFRRRTIPTRVGKTPACSPVGSPSPDHPHAGGENAGSLRLLLLAGALTGARLGDIATMGWADIDLAAATWTFVPMKTSRTGKRLVLPLLSPLLDELQAVRAASNSPDVFPRERELWKRSDLTKIISRHFEDCGITTNEAVAPGQARRNARVVVGFHSLRHTAATLAAKSGANLALVQKTLGHSTAGMTAHYTHTDTASARQVLAPLAEIMTGNHTAAL